MGLFGIGTTEKKETIQTTNEQVATESGLAQGGSGNKNFVSIQRVDPTVTGQAFDFASNAVDLSTRLGATAVNAATTNANNAIAANTIFASKFADTLGNAHSKDLEFLREVNQDNTATNLSTQALAKNALDSSFAIATRANPQSEGFVLENALGQFSKIFYVIGGIIAVGLLIYAFKRK